MDQRLVDLEPAQVPEIRLPGVGLVSHAVTRSGSKSVADESADISTIHHLTRRAVPGLPPPVLMNHQGHAGGFGILDDLLCRDPVGCDRFLANYRDRSVNRELHQRKM